MAMPVVTLTVSQRTYELLAQRARAAQREPDELADELLRAHVQLTDHPYVVRRDGFRGERPILRGSNIPVWIIAAMWKAGDSLEEIGQAYPHLEPAAIFDALSYYLDHQQEIEAEIAENRIERVLTDTGAMMDEHGVIRFPESYA
ncbi:MAG: DUF433 domain-containing protein [Anaerolineae bacterium]